MYVYHAGNYRMIRIRSECVHEAGEWVTLDHYVILDLTEAHPPMEVSIPREVKAPDDVEVQQILETLLGWGRQIEEEPLPPGWPAHPPRTHLRLVKDEPETDSDGQ
ncbi:hypothetical protein ACQPYK_50275 (plasmid) [Streptosporangium sp. CA-135522]|uniref:hypothetical protein n=1 Tax=Streptosporangium sp. CA-135522 TaxID=3240072 RepID=UPI003D8F241C